MSHRVEKGKYKGIHLRNGLMKIQPAGLSIQMICLVIAVMWCVFIFQTT